MRRALSSVLLIAVGIGIGMFIPAKSNNLTIEKQDGAILGGIVAVSYLAPNASAQELAEEACGSKTDLRNFEIAHAIATTSVYRFDCNEPGKDIQ